MRLGRPRRLLLPQIQTHTAQLIRCAFAESEQNWQIFSKGTPEQLQRLCRQLADRGHNILIGQCDIQNPNSFTSRILRGREHQSYPKARRGAQMTFLSRFAAVGQNISARTWKRSYLRPDTDLLSSLQADFPEE
jgi:hypothetical protein